MGSLEHILLSACALCGVAVFYEVGNRAESNKLVVAGHNLQILQHKSSNYHLPWPHNQPKAAVCMSSVLWNALLPCPYLSNVSFQLSSVQGIALEQMGTGVRTASESRAKENIKSSLLMQPEVKDSDSLFYIIHPDYTTTYTCYCIFGFHMAPGSKRVPSPRGRAPACCSSDRCSSRLQDHL